MKVPKWKLFIFILPCLLLFALIYFVPMCMVFYTSLFEWKPNGVFNFVGFRNYIIGFTQDARMHRAIINTSIWVALQSIVHVGIGTMIAFMLSRKRRGWKVLRTIYMMPNVISAAALGVIFLNVFNARYGLMNALIRVITKNNAYSKNWLFDMNSAFPTVTCSWLLYTGLIVIIVLAGISSLPEELVDAAKIDGASTVQVDLKIRLPLLRTIIGTCVLIAATSMLKEFELIFLMTNGGPGDETLNLPLYLYKTSLIDNNYGYANMMGVVLIVAGVLVVFLINKFFRMNQPDY